MAKVDPYLRPLYDALYDMVEPEGAQRLLERGTVEVAPLAFMRGRTLNASFIILDEAQNTTPEQMKMFLTRIGFGSKAVVTGDTTQVDVPGGRSGLDGLETILGGIDGLAFVRLTSRDVVRHRIVQDIVDAYERSRRQPPGHRAVQPPAMRPGPPSTNRRRRLPEDGDARGVRRRRAVGRARSRSQRWARLAEQVLRRRGRARAKPSCRCCSSTRRPSPSSTSGSWAHDGPTDVLAFPIDDDLVELGRWPDAGDHRARPRARSIRPTLPLLLGDVVICPAVAARNAPDARRHLRRRARAARRARHPARARAWTTPSPTRRRRCRRASASCSSSSTDPARDRPP